MMTNSSRTTGRWLLGAAAAVVLAAGPMGARSSPLISINSQADYQTAINTGRIQPVAAPYDALDFYGTQNVDWIYVAPSIAARSEADVAGVLGAGIGDGLVMSWGDAGSDISQVAAWEYVYDVDPDLTGTLLTLVITPPPCPVGSCISDVSLTLNSLGGGGGFASWFWTVGGGGPIFPGLPFTIAIDPTVTAAQSGATGFTAFNYDVTTVVSIQADERSVGSSGFANFPPVPVTGGTQPWNYWGPLNVTFVPAPPAALLLALGLIGLGSMRPGRVARAHG